MTCFRITRACHGGVSVQARARKELLLCEALGAPVLRPGPRDEGTVVLQRGERVSRGLIDIAVQ